MSEYTAYPLSWPIGWPRSKFCVHSRFGRYRPPTVALARDVVINELRRMNVADWRVIISTNIQLRRDGLPYSNQKEPSDTGVAVYWKDRKDKQLVLACDKYNTVGDNLYAIGKTIEATRAITRWGTVTAEQAFAGYVALNEKTGPSCWEILAITPQATEQQILDAYRRKARETHPDHNGTSEAFGAVVMAKDMALQLIKK